MHRFGCVRRGAASRRRRADDAGDEESHARSRAGGRAASPRRCRRNSYETLQVLLLLFRGACDGRSTASIAAELEIPVQTAAAVVLHLEQRGLVRRDGQAEHCYDRGAAEDGTVSALAHLYATEPAEVLRVMSTHAIERVRGSAARLFAEAFR